MAQGLHTIHIVSGAVLFIALIVRAVLLRLLMSDKEGERLGLVRVIRLLSPIMGIAAAALLLAGVPLVYAAGYSFAAPWLLTKQFITLLIFLLTFMGSSPATRQLSQDIAALDPGESLSEDQRAVAQVLYQMTLLIALMVVINTIVAFNKF
ncbi:MAG: DUF2269 family protein [Armatimonadetes bacterium]|nr:DUF2269 family protein [Armatimonadota bacterium]